MKLELNNIYCLDALEGLKQLEDNCIDLIITSPPYNLGNNHHTGTKKHQCYNDDMSEKHYQEMQVKVLNECYRVLKDNGSMMYNHKNRIKNGLQISPYQWIFKTKFLIKQEIIWINRSQNFDKIRFYPWTERIYWLVKDKKTKLTNTINKCDVFDWNEWEPVGTKGNHTRAFPVKMVKDIINVFPQAQVILDPYIGSGTTALGCKELNKKYIGFEINPEFINEAKKRLS